MKIQRRGPALGALTVLLASATACGPGDEVRIEVSREAHPEARYSRPDATPAERFGSGQMGHNHEAQSQPKGNPFVWETPEGWVELAPAQFRDINFRPAGNPEIDCYLTILQGNGGGLTANVNRWRGQFGLDAISDEEVAQLDGATLFGRDATRVEFENEGRKLMGVIFLSTSFMATVKMTGPADVVEAERAGFDLFCNTLMVRDEVAEQSTSSSSGGMSSSPGAELDYTAPEGWTSAEGGSMRLVNLRTPGGSECWIIRLGGQAGGLAANLNRWRSEVGMDELDEAGIDALERVRFLGEECHLLEVTGEYRGMGGQSGEGKMLLGIALIRSDSSLFVKMVGDEEDVATERQNFIDFLESIEEA